MADNKTFTVSTNPLSRTPTRVGVRHAYLPLTTTFTPSPACTNTISLSVLNVWQDGTAALASSELFAGWFYSDGEILPSSCIPFGSLASTTLFSTFYYSPGICPSGYTTARSTVGLPSINGYEAGETGAICCPQGYDPGSSGRCASSVTAGRTVIGLYSVNITKESGSEITRSTNVPWTTTLNSPGIVVARDLSIRFKEGDFPPPQSGSSTNSAVIAVAVVVPIVALIILITLILLWLRRRRNHKRVQPTISDLPEVSVRMYTAPDAGDKMIADPVDIARQRQRDTLRAQQAQSAMRNGTMEVVEELPVATSSNVDPMPRDDSGDKEVIEEWSATPRVLNPAPHDAGFISINSNRRQNLDYEGLISAEQISSQPSHQSQQSTRIMLEQELLHVQSEREKRELEQLRRREQEILVQLRDLER